MANYWYGLTTRFVFHACIWGLVIYESNTYARMKMVYVYIRVELCTFVAYHLELTSDNL